MSVQKFAITPGFEVGGTVFRSEQLEILGRIVGEDAKIELTTFKQLYVAMDETRLEEVQNELRGVGLQIHPAGFYTKSLIACNFCKGAVEAGLDIAKELDAAIAGHEVPNPLKIGYAGCALGTSEPLLKDIGVVKMRDTFDIYVGGEAKGLKAGLAQLLVSGITAEQLIPIIKRLITLFQEQGKKKENYRRFVERMTIETFRDSIA
ncbi:nitrite reductase [Cohnella sp. CIP 111063]|uniref:nitrite reductase n=1 Tax=unclassified Cohnella TaxID=2636738 RepID=UPI000B8BDBBB|nr:MULTISPECIES: nitrite reductase [unclassified Cohnella]OXS54932.1 nitrite reductase [Cohnella sp. CIP 111063]PRX65076.1 nitrite/sulfite reductase ferredoxin-like protein [Cohnella sp. SGD-V74]